LIEHGQWITVRAHCGTLAQPTIFYAVTMHLRQSWTVAPVVSAACVAMLWPAAGESANPPVVRVHEQHLTGYHMPSSSMEPTLHCARPGFGCEAPYPDRLVVAAPSRVMHRGDIFVFSAPAAAARACGAGGAFVKRLIALPGETWEERSGYVFINGKRLTEPYVQTLRRDVRTLPPRKIPRGGYFFMGDNRIASCDSRNWRTARRASIIGKVVRVFRQT
jgi:signal peptidase I